MFYSYNIIIYNAFKYYTPIIHNINYSEIAQTHFILRVLEIICVTPQVPVLYYTVIAVIGLRQQRVVFKIVKICNTLSIRNHNLPYNIIIILTTNFTIIMSMGTILINYNSFRTRVKIPLHI